MLKISVPPEVSCTHEVSGCCASFAAMVGADPGAQRMRMAQSDWPSRWESSWPTTRRMRQVEQMPVATGNRGFVNVI